MYELLAGALHAPDHQQPSALHDEATGKAHPLTMSWPGTNFTYSGLSPVHSEVLVSLTVNSDTGLHIMHALQ